MKSRMQAKDVPELPILEFLLTFKNKKWCNWFGDMYENSITRAIPEGTPSKIILAKMRAMIKKGLVDGCTCGCRGDFVITPKGEQAIHDLKSLSNPDIIKPSNETCNS